MSNSTITFRQSVISTLHAYGFSIFGGAVRDILSGDFFSPDWSGDLDAINYGGIDKTTKLLMMFLNPQSPFVVLSAEEVATNFVRLTLSSKDLSNEIQVDLVTGKISSYSYGCGMAEEDERDFLDLDVNGLKLAPTGIYWRDARQVGNLMDVLNNIRHKQFRVLKALNGKRIEKMRKLEAAGWVQIA